MENLHQIIEKKLEIPTEQQELIAERKNAFDITERKGKILSFISSGK